MTAVLFIHECVSVNQLVDMSMLMLMLICDVDAPLAAGINLNINMNRWISLNIRTFGVIITRGQWRSSYSILEEELLSDMFECIRGVVLVYSNSHLLMHKYHVSHSTYARNSIITHCRHCHHMLWVQ
jgi:hypothetical protein